MKVKNSSVMDGGTQVPTNGLRRDTAHWSLACISTAFRRYKTMPFLVVLQLYNLSQAEQSHWDNFKFHTDFDAGEKNEREKRPADRFLSPFFQFVVTSHPLSSFQSPATASRAATWSSAASSRPTPRSSPGSSTCESQPRARAPCPCPALCCTLLLAQQTVAAVVRRLHTALASVRTLAAANAFCIRRPLRPRSHTSRLRPQGAGFPFKVEVSLTIEYSFNAQVRALCFAPGVPTGVPHLPPAGRRTGRRTGHMLNRARGARRITIATATRGAARYERSRRRRRHLGSRSPACRSAL